MKTLYTWTTPNGRKISIALEEMGLEYTANAIDITKGEQMRPEFLTINPNHKIPALIETDGTVINESNAILLYLAQQRGQFVPATESPEYWKMMEWLMWQASGFGPMLGQAHHFLHYNLGKSEYSENRYRVEAQRLYGVLDQHLTGRTYMLDELSILEFSIWPWVARFSYHQINLNNYPAVKDWYLRLAERPAFQRGYAQPKDVEPIPRPEYTRFTSYTNKGKSMTDQVRTGSCQCGSTKYSIAPTEAKSVVCHCTSCQKQSASAFGAVVVVPADTVTLVAGTLKKWTRIADSGNEVHGYFCDTCGSRIWHGDKDTEAMLKVRAGTLETPINFAQAVHIWTQSKAPGIEVPDGAKSFPQNPG